MKASLINFSDFFDEKYRSINHFGIGAVSVITDMQMVTSYNEYGVDKKNGLLVKGLGRHEEELNLILGKIFNLSYIKDIQTFERLKRRLLSEVIFISYINDELVSQILIELPTKKSITRNQFLALEYLNEEIEKINAFLSRPIEIIVYNIYEQGTMRDEILPFLETIVDDSFAPTFFDENIIADMNIAKMKGYHFIK